MIKYVSLMVVDRLEGLRSGAYRAEVEIDEDERLPVWFSRLGIRVKKKRLCHYFLKAL